MCQTITWVRYSSNAVSQAAGSPGLSDSTVAKSSPSAVFRRPIFHRPSSWRTWMYAGARLGPLTSSIVLPSTGVALHCRCLNQNGCWIGVVISAPEQYLFGGHLSDSVLKADRRRGV